MKLPPSRLGWQISATEDSQVALARDLLIWAEFPKEESEEINNLGVHEEDMWRFGDLRTANKYLFMVKNCRPDQKLIDEYLKFKTDHIEEIFAKLPFVKEARRTNIQTEEGDEINVDNYLERRTDCWNAHTRRPGFAKFFTVGINISASAIFDEDLFQRKAVVATALAEAMRAKGYSLRLILFGAVEDFCQQYKNIYCPHNRAVLGFELVGYGQQWSDHQILSWCHQGGLRYHWMGWQDAIWPEVEQNEMRGIPRQLTVEEAAEMKIDISMDAVEVDREKLEVSIMISRLAEAIREVLTRKNLEFF